jgi:8-oxo-dGTP diphosphatase
MPEIVNGVLVRKRQILLARRSPARRAYAGRWSFPGGHVEAGESLDEALCRELREELGVVPVTYSALSPITDPHSGSTVYHMYAVTNWSGEPAIRDEEHSELRWLRPAAAALLDELALDAYRPMFARLAAMQP